MCLYLKSNKVTYVTKRCAQERIITTERPIQEVADSSSGTKGMTMRHWLIQERVEKQLQNNMIRITQSDKYFEH